MKGESVANVRKVCVVTGSSSGIGAATVRLYAKNGWDIVVNYSRDAAPADAVAAECRALGAQTLVVRADIAADADCRRLAVEVEQRFGRADVLVNNAGTTKFVAAKDLDGLDVDDFQRIYAVNVIGAYQMVRALVPLIERSGGGAIVNVSSIASMMGTGSSLAYMASKGALNALSVGLARSLAPQIRVNAIAPGLVETKFAAAIVQNPMLRDHVVNRTPLQRHAQPSELAGAAVYLLSDAASFQTGSVMVVDGGFTAV